MKDLPASNHAAIHNDDRNQPPDDEGPARRTDPELLVIGRMLRLLDDLDEPAKGRVVRYLHERYSVFTPEPPGGLA